MSMGHLSSSEFKRGGTGGLVDDARPNNGTPFGLAKSDSSLGDNGYAMATSTRDTNVSGQNMKFTGMKSQPNTSAKQAQYSGFAS